MEIHSITLAYFSPTGTTRRILESIAAGMSADGVTRLDLTPPAAQPRDFAPLRDTLVLFGVPVYAGRLPAVAAQRLRRLQGTGTPAVLVVVYGNRLFEDALLELQHLVVERGFRPVAGGGFLGEHSYSTVELPLSPGRPDAADLQRAADFGRQIREKVWRIAHVEDISPLSVPGNFPYREGHKPTDVAPVTDAALCTRCGACVTVCPTAAIPPDDPAATDPAACILCCACTRACPVGARALADPRIQQTRRWLYESCNARKEPEVYL